MKSKDFSKEIPLYRRTGHQDAANVMDPNEIRSALGNTPTKAQIKNWLIGGYEPKDFEGGLEFPENTTEAQKQTLLEAWADGWSEHAHEYMRTFLEERAQDRIFEESGRGLLDEGWYVQMNKGRNRGPFKSEKAALAEALKAEEEDD
jgi:hypothetical protein